MASGLSKDQVRKRGAIWRRVRANILAANPFCYRCGRIADTVDHIVPISKGGAQLDPANLRPACKSCNSARGNGTRQRLPTSREW